MVSDTRSGRKNKDNADNNSRGKKTDGKGATSSSSTIPETSGLRRSTRETSSKRNTNSSAETTPTKNVTASPSSTRKSERLGKQTSTPPGQKISEKAGKKIASTPPVHKKSEKLENQTSPTPLRRSGRGKYPSSSISSASKKSDKSLVSLEKQKKERKEKSVRQLTMETSEVCTQPLRSQRKTMNARKYAALFKQQRKKFKAKDGEELNARKASQDYSHYHIDSCGEEANGQKVGNDMEVSKGDVFAREIRDNAEQTEKECFAKEDMQSSELRDISEREKVPENDISLERGPRVLPAKRNRNETVINCNASDMLVNQDTGVSNTEAVTSPSKRENEICFNMCGTCSKRQRVDQGSKEQELCTCLATSKENLNEKLHDTSTVRVSLVLPFPDRRELKTGVITEPSAEFTQEQMQQKDHTTCGGKLDSFKFEEYWVPVQISNMQLEQYCFTLRQNSRLLSTPLRIKDLAENLQDILLSSRKCCDHPYLVNLDMRGLLLKDLKETEYLDVEIKASGKLQLLDRMLSELKTQGLRVLVYFQSIGGSGSDCPSIGDMLDDLLRLRFGPDSYERIDANLTPSKRQSAVNSFNKETGRFVFLLETRACLASIKLSSVDVIIIFGSDWNPVNDIRALQKITLDSQIGKVKIFRLYSSFTLEEKLLILSKQGKVLDGNLRNMSRSASHGLLVWGASCLVNRLFEFHDGDSLTSRWDSLQHSLSKDVIREFLTVLSQTGEDKDTIMFNRIVNVQQIRYGTDFSLFGESYTEVTDEGLPDMSWLDLLKEKQLSWKYISPSPQRSRKRVQYIDNLHGKPEASCHEVMKRQKKVTDNVELSFMKPGGEEKLVSGDKEGAPASGDTINENQASTDPSFVNEISEIRRQSCERRKSFHILFWPEMAKLCEVLQLKEDVKNMVEKFHEFVVNNYRVSREPETILQAFQISLCWIAASVLKLKIDRSESLNLAKQHLNFSCTEEEAEGLYLILKKAYKIWVKKEHSHTRSSKSVKAIQKKFQKKMDKLHQRQEKEKNIIIQKYDEEKARLENKKKTAAAVIRLHSHPNSAMQIDKLKMLESEYTKQFEELNRNREVQLNDLEARYAAYLNNLREEARQLEALQSSKSPSNESGHIMQHLQANEQLSAQSGQENNIPVSCHLTKGRSPERIDGKLHNVSGQCGNVTENVSLSVKPSGGADEMNVIPSEEAMVAGAGELEKATDVVDNPENVHSVNPCSAEQISDGAFLKFSNGQSPLGVTDTIISCHSPQDTVPEMCSVDEGVHEGATLGTNTSPEVDIPGEVTGTLRSSDGLENVAPVDVPLSEEQICDRVPESMPDRELSPGVTQSAVCAGPDDVEAVSLPSFQEQVSNVAKSTAGEVQVMVPENVNSHDDLGNIVRVNPSSSREQIPNITTPLAGEALSAVPGGSGGLDRSNTVRANEVCATTSDNAAAVERHHSASHDIHRQQPFENSSSMQTPITITQGVPSAPNQAREDVVTEATLLRMHDGDPGASRMQSTAEQVEPPPPLSVEDVESDCPNHETPSTESPVAEMRPLNSTDIPTSHNTPDMPTVSQIECQSSSEHLSTGAPMTVAHSAVPIPLVSQPPASCAQNSAVDTCIRGSQTNISDSRTSSITSGYGNYTVQVTTPQGPRLTSNSTQDPLQKELERLRKEINDTIMIHEETKRQLKSDCEREIEEVVSRIRRKFDVKLQETQAEFIHKKNKLDTIHNKVYMNRILAEAFRSKCMDIRAPGSGAHQDISSSFVHQLVQAQRTSLLSGPTPSTAPSATPQTISTPAVCVHTTPHNAADPHSLPAVHRQSDLFSNSPIRPPHINNVPSASSNHQVGSGIRAPAPHLQPFRPSISTRPTSLPSTGRLPSQQVSCNSPQLPPRPQLPVYQAGSQIRAHQPDTVGCMPSRPNTPQSALDLLMDVGNRSRVNSTPPSSLPTPSDLIHRSSPLVQSGQNRPTNPSLENGALHDVVCISDDED